MEPASLPSAMGPALVWLDLAGILVFAASGALLAADVLLGEAFVVGGLLGFHGRRL